MPVIVTVVPVGPEAGEKDVIVGGGTTVNFVSLAETIPFAVAIIGPVVAFGGTDTVIDVVELAVTTAAVPLNVTVLFAGTGSKLMP